MSRAVVLVLVLAACGSDRSSSNTAESNALHVTTSGAPLGSAGPAPIAPAAPRATDAATAHPATGFRATRVAMGGQYRCALGSNHTVRCWGTLLGTTAATPIELPIHDVVDLDVSNAIAGWIAVVTGDGALRIANANGPGTFDTVATGIAKVRLWGGTDGLVLRSDGTVAEFHLSHAEHGGPWTLEQTPHPELGKAIELRTANAMRCILAASGTVSCFPGTRTLAPVPGVTDAVALLRAGDDEICAQLRHGPPRCWDDRLEPMTEALPDDVVAVTGGDGNARQRCAWTSAGAVRCLGRNRSGEVGIGHKSARVATWSPVALPAPATEVALGYGGSCALLGDGDVACWGSNANGELGDGTRIDRAAPVRVAGLLADTLPPARDGLDAVGQSEVEMDWTGLPKDCRKPTEMIDITTGAAFPVISAYAWDQDRELHVALADYRIEPLDREAVPRGAQHEISLGLARWSDASPRPVDRGTYLAGDGATRKLSVWTEPLFTRNWGNETRARVTHVDNGWVCGTLDIAVGTERKPRPRPFAARRIHDDGD